MTRHSVQEYAASVRQRYRAGKRREKARILDEFCATTRMHRKAAIRLLNQEARPRAVGRGRPRRYGHEVVEPLSVIWEAGDRMCGKLLGPALPDLLTALERHGELKLSPEIRMRLLQASPATLDRLLARYKRVGLRQPRLKRPAATGLKAQVPVRTWSEWQGVPVGSVQADLVLHCGESLAGFFLTSLCAVDVATGWTELQAVWGLGKERVAQAIHHVSLRLPFSLVALHTDNGSEFINHTLVDWCRRHGVSFSRGRSYRKNDQAYVEQRNWITVRRQVGYDRLASKAALALLQQLYSTLRLQLNFFRPVRKLVSKQRLGAKVVKQYDEPRTPYQRLLASGALSDEQRLNLEAAYLSLNPVVLRQRVDQLQRQLWRLGGEERKLGSKLG
jgi:transposase InsO family protein